MTDPRPSRAHLQAGDVPREVIPRDPHHSFRYLVHDFPSEICGWASHPEYEII